jgi:hypothetical protein
MLEGLKPCPFRSVDDEGRILCAQIQGDREASVNLCRACPAAAINCQHLRSSLYRKNVMPLTVRYATGRVEVWNNTPPTVEFNRAACAAKTMPIHSPRDCMGCTLRLAQVVPQAVLQPARRSIPRVYADSATPAASPLPAPTITAIVAASNPQPVAQNLQPIAAAEPDAAQAERKSKIVVLQEWLAAQAGRRKSNSVQEIAASPAPPPALARGIENCVGWTD